MAYFGGEVEYLRSDATSLHYGVYREHEVVALPLRGDGDVCLILSLPMLDEGLIASDAEHVKYTRDQKYLRFAIHPHDLHKVFEEEEEEEQVQVFVPRVARSFSSSLKDHHVVSTGLSTMWLPLYYGRLCLATLASASRVRLDAEGVGVELLSVGCFDAEKRVWAAMRYKYGLSDFALKCNWFCCKRALLSKLRWPWRSNKKKMETETHDDVVRRTLVFDRPFDFYLYDRRRQICYVSGTVTSPTS